MVSSRSSAMRALLQHDAHEDEQRDGDQHVVGHDAEDALAQRAEERQVHDAEQPAEEGEQDRHAGKREHHRKAEQDAAHSTRT
jgi:hypothetical protein